MKELTQGKIISEEKITRIKISFDVSSSTEKLIKEVDQKYGTHNYSVIQIRPILIIEVYGED